MSSNKEAPEDHEAKLEDQQASLPKDDLATEALLIFVVLSVLVAIALMVGPAMVKFCTSKENTIDWEALAGAAATLAAGAIAALSLRYLAVQVNLQREALIETRAQFRETSKVNFKTAELNAFLADLEVKREVRERTWAVVETLWNGSQVEFRSQRFDVTNDREFTKVVEQLCHRLDSNASRQAMRDAAQLWREAEISAKSSLERVLAAARQSAVAEIQPRSPEALVQEQEEKNRFARP